MLGNVVVLTVVWAMPTDYAARLLVESDPRLRHSLARDRPELLEPPRMRRRYA
jgi:hypothetical protein